MPEDTETRCIAHAEMLRKMERQLDSIEQSIEERLLPLITDLKEELWPGGGNLSLLSRVSALEGDLHRTRKDLGMNGGLSLGAQLEVMKSSQKADHEELGRFKMIVWKLVVMLIAGGSVGGSALALFK